jgi:hypothetical protein
MRTEAKIAIVVAVLVSIGVSAIGVASADRNRDSCECRELKRIRQILEWIAPPGIPGDGNPGGGGELP